MTKAPVVVNKIQSTGAKEAWAAVMVMSSGSEQVGKLVVKAGIAAEC